MGPTNIYQFQYAAAARGLYEPNKGESMTTVLDNGVVVEEHITAHNYTPDADVRQVFPGYEPIKHGCTVHHWGALGQLFDDVVRYLASNNARGTSAQFILQEDRVACIVSPDDVAWHSGHPQGNVQTIGIECRPEMTPGDLATLASLLRHLERIYGSLVVYIHSQWVATACPGRYAAEIENIIADVNNVELTPAPHVPITPTTPVHDCCCHD